jgi:hypothetical protein
MYYDEIKGLAAIAAVLIVVGGIVAAIVVPIVLTSSSTCKNKNKFFRLEIKKINS